MSTTYESSSSSSTHSTITAAHSWGESSSHSNPGLLAGDHLSDILTDGMGIQELDFEAQREITRSLHESLSSLPAVTERMREESLEDCDAFKDLKHERRRRTRTQRRRRGKSSISSNNSSGCVLEPLEEE